MPAALPKSNETTTQNCASLLGENETLLTNQWKADVLLAFQPSFPPLTFNILLKGGRLLIVKTIQKARACLALEGRSPIPLAFRTNAWFRSDGSLIVEGEASTDEDLTLMIGARGRIDMDNQDVRLGVRIAATDHERGIVRFLVQPRTIL